MAEAKLNFEDIKSTAGGVLAKLWRNTLRDNNLYPSIGYLVSRYTSRNSVTETKNSIRKTKASLIANIRSGEMTWKTYTKLMFEFLGVRKIDITVKLTLANNSETIHSVTVVNDTIKNDNKEKDTTDEKDK